MLDDLKDERKVVGTKQALRALNNNEVKAMYIANDAEEHVIRDVVNLAKEKNIEIIYVDTMKELGEACSIDVSAATVAILCN